MGIGPLSVMRIWTPVPVTWVDIILAANLSVAGVDLAVATEMAVAKVELVVVNLSFADISG